MFGKKIKLWNIYTGYSDPHTEEDVQVLEFINESPNKDPMFEHEGDSGFDLRAWFKEEEDGVKKDKKEGITYIELKPLERRMIHTGLYFKLPECTELQCRPRSGCSIRDGLTLINCVGTVDECFRGEVCILAVNISDKKLTIKNGERIAQGVLCPVYNSRLVKLINVDDIDKDTERGSDGYGSSGRN